MRVLMTGHHGYIGSVMSEVFHRAGHEVTGLDTYFYEGCDFGVDPVGVRALLGDVRDVDGERLRGFDAVVHLAALSNDPLGCLDESCTRDINHRASARLAREAKRAGVPRFLFASSCSLYGAAGDEILDERAAFSPVTAYADSKVLAEAEISTLADESFSPTFLRNATAYGASPRFRGDVVVNNFVAHACTSGEVVVQSDGTPWRPLVHVKDLSRAFLEVLQAPRDLVHNQSFNVGSTAENYRIRDVATIVADVVRGCSIRYREGAGPDPRCYRVNCDRLAAVLPGARTHWTVRRGVEEIYDACLRNGLTRERLPEYVRLSRIQWLRERGQLDDTLRWIDAGAPPGLGRAHAKCGPVRSRTLAT